MRIILASASPRRADLLRAAGFTFDVCAADIDERPREGERPHEYVERLAVEKAGRVLEMAAEQERKHGGVRDRRDGTYDRHSRARKQENGPAGAGPSEGLGSVSTSSLGGILTIGADTAVVVDGRILGKPVDSADAERMLRQLAGRTHVVLTGVSVQTSSTRVGGVDETRVVFAPLTDAQIAWYVDSREGWDKAGAYAIQGLASRFIPRIEGSYSNVVGLPLALVDALIRDVTGGSSVLASAR